jgi:hypothetical protein
MGDSANTMRKQARAQTDPLFFLDYFLAHGHDVNAKSAIS